MKKKRKKTPDMKKDSYNEVCAYIADNADKIREKLDKSLAFSKGFLVTCEEAGMLVDIVEQGTGKKVDWRDCPPEYIKEFAKTVFTTFVKDNLAH